MARHDGRAIVLGGSAGDATGAEYEGEAAVTNPIIVTVHLRHSALAFGRLAVWMCNHGLGVIGWPLVHAISKWDGDGCVSIRGWYERWLVRVVR